MCRSKWCEIFCIENLSALGEWVFYTATGPKERKGKLQKRWEHWEQHSPELINTLSVEGPVTIKKVSRSTLFKQKLFALHIEGVKTHAL